MTTGKEDKPDTEKKKETKPNNSMRWLEFATKIVGLIKEILALANKVL